MRAVALSTVFFALVMGCGPEGPEGPDGCEYSPAALASEPCCEGYGVDACAGGLLCAALDEPTIARCHFAMSRADGQSCLADDHCVSMSCNTAVGACRAWGLECDPEIGCAPFAGMRRACADDFGAMHCLDVGDGSLGEVCEGDSDCNVPFHCDLDAGRCASESTLGQPCEWDASTDSPSTAGCSAPLGGAECWPLSQDASDRWTGFCIESGYGSCGPEFLAFYETGGPTRCVPRCETAADCPVPGSGCHSDSRGSFCTWCRSNDECRPGQTCVPAAGSGALCM